MPLFVAVGASMWVDIAGTVVSVIAIVVALLIASRGPEWSARRRRPVLELNVEMDTLARVRLSVENDPSRETAQDVQVIVERVQISPRTWVIRSKSPEVAFLRVNRSLHWAETEPPSTSISVSPGYSREVEFLCFRSPTAHDDEVDSAGPAEGIVEFGTASAVDLGLFDPELSWGAYVKTRRGLGEYPATVWLAVTCGNAPARRYTAKIYYSGYWPFMPFGNAMRLPAHVRVELEPGRAGGEPLPDYEQFRQELDAIDRDVRFGGPG